MSLMAQGNKDTYLPGYVITTKNDSLRGFILIQDNYFNSINCVFKTSQDGNTTTYSADQLVSYGTDDKKYYYYAGNVGLEGKPEKKVFLECIVKGKNSLFYNVNQFYLKSQSGVVELTTQEHTITRDSKTFTTQLPVFRSTLQNEMKDCGAIYDYLQTTKLERKSLTELFVKYNECVGVQSVVFKKNLKGGVVHWGFSLGVTATQLTFTSVDNPNADYHFLNNSGPGSTNLTPSFWTEFSLSNPRFRLRTGATFYNANYRSYSETATDIRELTIKSLRLEIPLHAKYVFSKRNTGMYAIGGLGVNAFLQWDPLLTITTPPNPNVNNITNLKTNPIVANLMGGIGYEYQAGKFKLFAEANYGFIPDMIILSTAKCSMSAFTFTGGILF